MAPTVTPSVGDANALRLGGRLRNNDLIDIWSVAHVAWGVGLTIVFGPLWAIIFLVAWEPFEIFLLGPTLARHGIPFGHETWRNSLSDMFFDAAGAALGFLIVVRLWDPMGLV